RKLFTYGKKVSIALEANSSVGQMQVREMLNNRRHVFGILLFLEAIPEQNARITIKIRSIGDACIFRIQEYMWSESTTSLNLSSNHGAWIKHPIMKEC
ncbi:hypothetical protein XEUV315_23050, partial [Xanthomonas euvesicatoria]